MNHRLRQLRKALDMNQVDFAKRLGLSQSTLAILEAGKRNFNEKRSKKNGSCHALVTGAVSS